MTCVAMGLLLRVSYELERTERQVALRGETMQVEAREVDTVEMPVETHRVAPVVAAPARGTSFQSRRDRRPHSSWQSPDRDRPSKTPY